MDTAWVRVFAGFRVQAVRMDAVWGRRFFGGVTMLPSLPFGFRDVLNPKP